jgi:hypothetical protein
VSWRVATAPQVELSVLGALAVLLQGTDPFSQSRAIDAALISHDSNRGEVHAAQAQDLPARIIHRFEP